ncbi:MAG TPA: hypothetical protein VGE37_08880 [Archangium sp.]
MTHDELARRKPVWDAMSDLFLDTETRWSVPYVARRCAESTYDDEVLEHVFWGEVFPLAIGNLLDIAGEWAALQLDEEALIKRANHPSIPWLTRRAHGWMVEQSWLAARAVTPWLRGLHEDDRHLTVRALDLLGRRFFEDVGRESLTASQARFDECLEVARKEWVRYEPVCRAMAGKEQDVEACAAEVRRLLRLA